MKRKEEKCKSDRRRRRDRGRWKRRGRVGGSWIGRRKDKRRSMWMMIMRLILISRKNGKRMARKRLWNRRRVLFLFWCFDAD